MRATSLEAVAIEYRASYSYAKKILGEKRLAAYKHTYNHKCLLLHIATTS